MRERPPDFPDPDETDIMAGDRRISRPDSRLPDWEVPDSAYRPVPIVWFTGALIAQTIAVFAIFMALLSQHGAITIALSGVVTGAIVAWTWDRGMKQAGRAWQIATVTVLALQFLLVCLGASDRL